MDLFTRTSACRRALQRVSEPQQCWRRTFYSNSVYYTWKSPVPLTKIRHQRLIQLPPAVTTFDPIRLTSANHFEISSLGHIFRKMASQQKADPHVRQCGNIVQTTNTPFPANTRGFLYFHSVANQSPLSGGLRFRVTENPSSFIEGHDLLMDSGLPWQIPIWELTTRKQWRTFLKVLVADGFAPPEMQIACNSMNVERDSVFITAFNMPWLVNFDWEFSRVYFAPPDRHPTPALVRLPWYSKAGFVRTPYTGRALVSLVTRSDGQLGLRVEKILSLQHRATNDRTIVPKEGQVTPFNPRLILKTTKMSEKKMDQLSGFIHSAINRMPSAPTTPNPLDVYRHHPLPRSQLDFLIAKCGVHPELGGYKPYPSLAN